MSTFEVDNTYLTVGVTEGGMNDILKLRRPVKH